MFIAISWAAVVFAVFGLLAIVLNRDPVPSGVNSYYGILELALAGVIVWLAVSRVPRARGPWLSALVAAAGVYLLAVLTGAVAGGLRLGATQATSPFAIAAAGLAMVTVIASWVGIRIWRSR